MAGGPGYWLVVLANGHAGVAKTSANQMPKNVGGSTVTKTVYLGASRQNAVGNWNAAVRDVFSLAPGLSELPPPGAESAVVGSGTDLGTLLDYADKHGAGILTKTPSGAEGDPTPTILAGGLGFVEGAAVIAATDVAAAAGGAGAEGATAGGAGAAAGAAAKAASAVPSIVGGLTVASLFTNTSLWAGVGMTLLGAFLVLFGIIKLSGADPKAVAKRVMP